MVGLRRAHADVSTRRGGLWCQKHTIFGHTCRRIARFSDNPRPSMLGIAHVSVNLKSSVSAPDAPLAIHARNRGWPPLRFACAREPVVTIASVDTKVNPPVAAANAWSSLRRGVTLAEKMRRRHGWIAASRTDAGGFLGLPPARVAPKAGGRKEVFFTKYTWHSKSVPRRAQQAFEEILPPFLERFCEWPRDAFIFGEQKPRSARLVDSSRDTLFGISLSKAGDLVLPDWKRLRCEIKRLEPKTGS